MTQHSVITQAQAYLRYAGERVPDLDPQPLPARFEPLDRGGFYWNVCKHSAEFPLRRDTGASAVELVFRHGGIELAHVLPFARPLYNGKGRSIIAGISCHGAVRCDASQPPDVCGAAHLCYLGKRIPDVAPRPLPAKVEIGSDGDFAWDYGGNGNRIEFDKTARRLESNSSEFVIRCGTIEASITIGFSDTDLAVTPEGGFLTLLLGRGCRTGHVKLNAGEAG